MLQQLKRIRAIRQFRRLVKAGFGEALSTDELAQLQVSWVQMRTESPAVVAPMGAKYAFGWELKIARAPSRSFTKKMEPFRPSGPKQGPVPVSPSDEADEREHCQPVDRTPIATIDKPQWFVAFTRQFRKDIDGMDRKLQGRVLEAISEICEAPLTPKGDTVKPLVGQLTDLWRYRIGDFRLVYHPDAARQRVTLLQFASRGSVY